MVKYGGFYKVVSPVIDLRDVRVMGKTSSLGARKDRAEKLNLQPMIA